MNLEEFSKRVLSTKSGRGKNTERDLAFEIGYMLEDARIFKNITQTELAQKLKTHQPSIARLERGRTLPSLRFLEKIAEALGTFLIPPKFGFFSEVEYYKTIIQKDACNVSTITQDWPSDALRLTASVSQTNQTSLVKQISFN